MLRYSNDILIRAIVFCRPVPSILNTPQNPTNNVCRGLNLKDFQVTYENRFHRNSPDHVPIGAVSSLAASFRFYYSITPLTVLARRFSVSGFIKKALTPIALAFCSFICSLKPVHRIMGISGRMLMSSRASLSPVIFGMVMSVTTTSK